LRRRGDSSTKELDNAVSFASQFPNDGTKQLCELWLRQATLFVRSQVQRVLSISDEEFQG
jgi:hypothetical protein